MNLKEWLQKAYEEKFAIPQFNFNNLEFCKWILEKCEQMKSPVILGASESAINYMGGVNTVSLMVKGLIKDLNITVPVFLHLDHGKTVDICKRCYEAGFDSVMIDASNLMLANNICLTGEVCNTCNCYIESEIGAIKVDSYADVKDCILLNKHCDIDMLAIAVGNVHGIYKDSPNLQFQLIKEIRKKTGKPLVLHGGTGISDLDLKMAIECGISKVNFNTELQIAWHDALIKYVADNKEVYDPRKNILSGKEAVKTIVEYKILVLGSNNKVS